MDYRIPMHRLSIQLLLADGTRKDADIFLHTVSDLHAGPETLDEFLNNTRSFIPCLVTDSEDPFLCNKDLILALETESVDDHILRNGEAEPTAIHQVRIRFIGGVEIEGQLRVFLSSENCRVSDFLNESENFFPIHMMESAVAYVHRRYIEEVVPVEEGLHQPPPAFA